MSSLPSRRSLLLKATGVPPHMPPVTPQLPVPPAIVTVKQSPTLGCHKISLAYMQMSRHKPVTPTDRLAL